MSDLFEGITPNIGDYYTNQAAARAASSNSNTTSGTDIASGTEKVDQWWLLPDKAETETKSNTDLTFEDMLMLMVTQLQNQTIDNQADTNDMMNQLISMTVMQALTEMSAQVQDLTDANVMSYSASLVGKEVTVGVIDSKTGKLSDEIVGTVTATGTYNGQQVIFLGERYFPLSSIMAVGRLPDEAVDGTTTKKPSTTEPTDPDDKVDGSDGTEDGNDGADVENPENTGNTEDPETAAYRGEHGIPEGLPIEEG